MEHTLEHRQPPTPWEGANLRVDHPLDVPGLIRRARRTADLSQRDLAERLGVSQSTVARWETGRLEPCLHLLLAVLRLAGLALAVTDATRAIPAECALPADSTAPTVGDQSDPAVRTAPMRPDSVRDRGGRRYPAHLDVEAIPEIWWPRWDRPELTLLCRRRPGRDVQRRRTGVVPADHPTPHEISDVFAARRAERRARLKLLLPSTPTPVEECCCLVECHDGRACRPDCPCGCEDDPWGEWPWLSGGGGRTA